MRLALTIALASIALVTSAPAAAAITIGGVGSSTSATITDDTTIGSAFTLNFDAEAGNVVIPGVTSSITLTFEGTSGSSYLFNYLVNNTSSATSRVTVFGFDTDPNLSGASSTGLFDTVSAGSITNQSLEVCFDHGQTNNCNNSTGGVGVTYGSIGSGTLTLTFGSLPNSIALSNFIDRYQSLAGNEGSAIGLVQTPPVPEPATWGMMLLGFAGIGLAIRKRRASDALMQVA